MAFAPDREKKIGIQQWVSFRLRGQPGTGALEVSRARLGAPFKCEVEPKQSCTASDARYDQITK